MNTTRIGIDLAETVFEVAISRMHSRQRATSRPRTKPSSTDLTLHRGQSTGSARIGMKPSKRGEVVFPGGVIRLRYCSISP